jgi:hypothetical protein
MNTAEFDELSAFFCSRVVSIIIEVLCPVVLRKQWTVAERIEPVRSVQKVTEVAASVGLNYTSLIMLGPTNSFCGAGSSLDS